MAQTFINRLHMRGFKSFNQKTILDFGSGLNCIVGPNGSGKSNCLDALCFVLGRSSAKSIRAENVADLLHKKKESNIGSADVVLRLDNTFKVFPLNSQHIEITRRITKEGLTKYYVNGRRANRQQIIELLSIAKIHSDGHNIILQGDIDKFISMSSVEKRKIIEEIAGISVYEARKQNALRELEKVEEKLKEVKIILTEKQAYLKGLEAEKQQAEKYRGFTNELKSARATELQLRISAINRKKSEIQSKLNKIEALRKKLNSKLEEHRKKIEFIQSKISFFEDEIEKKGGEGQLELERTISELKLAIENSKNIILSSKNEINRINQRKKQLESNLLDINRKLADKKRELNSATQERNAYKKRIYELTGIAKSSAKSINELEKLIEQKEKQLDELKARREKIREEISKINSNLKILEYRIEEANKTKAALKEIYKSKDFYKSLLVRINELEAKDAVLAEKVSNLRQKIDDKKEAIAKLRIDSGATEELLMRDRAVSQILKSRKALKGIIGTVAQLGTSDQKYRHALAVVAGSRMKNIVVDNENTAIQCLILLKRTKAGVATFLPLNKLKAGQLSLATKQASARPGVYGLASELVACDQKYKKVFQHIFRDTLVVHDANIAKSLGIGKFNMVTLDGDIFLTSGAITGGFRRRVAGIKFAEADVSAQISKEEQELSKLKKALLRAEKERAGLQEKLIKLRQEKAEIEGKLDAVDISDPAEIVQQSKDLILKQNALRNNKTKLKKEDKEISTKINKLIIEKNAILIKIKDLRFGTQSSELKQLESKVKDVDAKIATIMAVIENSLEPEQENIKKLLIHLAKERAEFEEQIAKEKKNIAENTKTLESKQKEEKEFYGALKKLFAEKKKYVTLLDKEQRAVREISEQLTGDDEEYNALAIAKAKIEAEFAAVSEEFEPYKKTTILKHLKTISHARRRQEELKRKIDELGSVNMRALEIYENVKKEYNNLVWRVEKLRKEREAVISVISQIEVKKKDSFIATFEGVNKHFQSIFAKISNKMRAELILENLQNPFDGGITIRVRDQHNKSMYLGSLSGGEKTLVALAFIFAIQEHDPAPFYLLDEIDAALDKLNSEKVARLLKEYSKKSQIIIISHNDAIISAADNLYGVWMNKKGESFVSSLKI